MRLQRCSDMLKFWFSISRNSSNIGITNPPSRGAKNNSFLSFSPSQWNTGLVFRVASLTSWREGASVGNPSSDGVTIKMPYGVDVLHRPACTQSFPIGLVKTESEFILRSIETGLGRWTLVEAVISVDTYPSPWGYSKRCFLVAVCRLIARRPNLEVATERLLHQQVKIQG